MNAEQWRQACDSQVPKCRFVLTRGKRKRTYCGKPVCVQNGSLCLVHWRNVHPFAGQINPTQATYAMPPIEMMEQEVIDEPPPPRWDEGVFLTYLEEAFRSVQPSRK